MAWTITATLGDTTTAEQKLLQERTRLRNLATKLPADVQTIEERQLLMAAQQIRGLVTLIGPKFAGGVVTGRGSGAKGQGFSLSVAPK